MEGGNRMAIQEPQYEAFVFRDDGEIPNNENLPLVIYPGILNDFIDRMNKIFLREGWNGIWIGSVFDYHHYHSTAHEVLGVVSGHATIQFGGRNGREISVKPGDVVMIPAGVGHKSNESSSDFRVVGGYPEGQERDLCTGHPSERPEVLRNISAVPLPTTDPVYGENGKLLDLWTIR